MQCKYCGRELAEGSAFCNYCGRSQREPAGQAAPGAAPTPPPAGPATLRCPHCGSTRIQFTTTVKTKGVSVGDACCGYVCLGPIGLLCGLCGAGSSETKESWICCDCGTKFTAEEAQKAVKQQMRQEQNMAKKQQEREAQLATWHSLMDNCPYPPEQLNTLYDAAVKQEESKDKLLRAHWNEERKAVKPWQTAAYGMNAGLVVLLVGMLIFVISLLSGDLNMYSLVVAVLGVAVFVLFSKRDEQMFDQYASATLQDIRQEKEQASRRKAELKKYREAYQGLQAENGSRGA